MGKIMLKEIQETPLIVLFKYEGPPIVYRNPVTEKRYTVEEINKKIDSKVIILSVKEGSEQDKIFTDFFRE
jgi:hypothetical protein